MQERQQEKDNIDNKKSMNEKKIKEVTKKLQEAKETNKPIADLEKELKQLEIESNTIKKDIADFQKKEKVH